MRHFPIHPAPLLAVALLALLLALPIGEVWAQRFSVGMSMRADGFFNTPPDCGKAFEAPFAPVQRRPFGGLFTSSTYATLSPFTMSSTSTECVDDALTRAERERLRFVAFNGDALAEDVARGGGAHLTALGGLLGCPVEALPALGPLLRPHQARLFSNREATAADVLAGMRAALAGVPHRTAFCRG